MEERKIILWKVACTKESIWKAKLKVLESLRTRAGISILATSIKVNSTVLDNIPGLMVVTTKATSRQANTLILESILSQVDLNT
jgi:hypothetical protein